MPAEASITPQYEDCRLVNDPTWRDYLGSANFDQLVLAPDLRERMGNQDREFAARYKELGKYVDSLSLLEEDWDSYGGESPNAFAIEVARQAIDGMASVGVLPDSITASTDGGVMLEMIRGSMYYLIDIYNEGEVVFLQRSGEEDPKSVDVDINTLDIFSILAYRIGNGR
ncbi:MAG: hypothetical protein ABIQ57_03790 [Candidatus Kapaibacterium sp.]